ncbi:MAG: hypothetical protein KC766_40445 [Myxococcales bacterium]|nr:hypothetical protein [Myxococcales bacterium]
MRARGVCLLLCGAALGCSSEVITLAASGEQPVPGGSAGAGAAGAGGAGQGGLAVGGAGAASGGGSGVPGGSAGGGFAGSGAQGGSAGTGFAGSGAQGGSAGTGFAGSAAVGGSAGGSGLAGSGGVPCEVGSGCGGSSYCEPDSCGSLSGSCQSSPSSCDGAFEPTCGCDGLTYWSACVRAQAGVGELHPGECEAGVAVECADGQPCGDPTATCFSAEPSCQAAACWVLPCPVASSLSLMPCSAGGCVDACTAPTAGPVFLDGACP